MIKGRKKRSVVSIHFSPSDSTDISIPSSGTLVPQHPAAELAASSDGHADDLVGWLARGPSCPARPDHKSGTALLCGSKSIVRQPTNRLAAYLSCTTPSAGTPAALSSLYVYTPRRLLITLVCTTPLLGLSLPPTTNTKSISKLTTASHRLALCSSLFPFSFPLYNSSLPLFFSSGLFVVASFFRPIRFRAPFVSLVPFSGGLLEIRSDSLRYLWA